MENRARVCDIKKKFESLNAANDVPKQRNQEKTGNDPLASRCHIKRSNAFRSDKPPQPKPEPGPPWREPVAERRRVEPRQSVPPRIDDLPERVRDVLRSPLPRGPPPKKPPRTFQHVLRPPVRSKTESQILLRNKRPVADANTNIYDEPFDGRGDNERYGTVSRPQQPLYSQPYSPSSSRKAASAFLRSFIGERKRLQNDKPPPINSKKPLHYMSSPIPGSNDPELDNRTTDLNKIQNLVKEAYGVPADSDTDSSMSTSDDQPVSEEVTAKRKGYVRQMSTVRRRVGPGQHQPSGLFTSLLLVGLDSDPTSGKRPYTKYKYPPLGAKPGCIEEFVFADSGGWPPASYPHSYTLVLTGAGGARSYAHCRRVRPEGATIPLPLAYCIITPHPFTGFYQKVLAELENQHGTPEFKFKQLVQSLFEAKLPQPGQHLRLKGGLSIKREEGWRKEDTGLERLMAIVSIPVFLQIFSTLLLERKVLLLSSNISKLSDCVEGLLLALYPLSWEHTVVTAVPSSMSELLSAPTPYLLGVLHPLPNNTNIDQALLVDIDSGKVTGKVGDEGSVIPKRLLRGLRSALTLASTSSKGTSTSLVLSEALLRLWVELIGHYHQHIITSLDTNIRKFQRDTFVKSVESKSIENFLEWFTETAMFQVFIANQLDRNHRPGIFEQRCVEHIEEKTGNKRGRSLVRNIGERIIDWTGAS